MRVRRPNGTEPPGARESGRALRHGLGAPPAPAGARALTPEVTWRRARPRGVGVSGPGVVHLHSQARVAREAPLSVTCVMRCSVDLR